jgi:dienelactone hydrolase
MRRLIRFISLYVVLPAVLVLVAGVLWLRWDAGRPLEPWFEKRHGNLLRVEEADVRIASGQRSSFMTITSDSGLSVGARVIRPDSFGSGLPVLIVLGGHRTGSDAADLFGHVGERAVVAMDYPYDGPEKVRGLVQIMETLPLARQAFRDTPPAVSLAIDWIVGQPWADPDRLVIIGASLGVPFATAIAARDQRISGALLVHGAADNLNWLEVQVARRNDAKVLHRPLATLIHWAAYGPTFDTAYNVALIAPRPVVVIGAKADERTPAEQTEALFDAALEPKVLRWTGGQHVQPNRPDVIAELLAIADEVLPFGPQGDR